MITPETMALILHALPCAFESTADLQVQYNWPLLL